MPGISLFNNGYELYVHSILCFLCLVACQIMWIQVEQNHKLPASAAQRGECGCVCGLNLQQKPDCGCSTFFPQAYIQYAPKFYRQGKVI